MSLSVYFTHDFEAPIEKFGVGKTRKIWYNVLFLPKSVEANLPFDQYPRLRIEGEIADVPIANAFMPTGDDRFYVIVAPNVLKDADLSLGDVVEMRFRIADQDYVDVPDTLQKTIDRTKRNQAAWSALTPGKQRMLAQHVLSAKTAPTREKRVSEALEALLDHGGDLRAWRRSKD